MSAAKAADKAVKRKAAEHPNEPAEKKSKKAKKPTEPVEVGRMTDFKGYDLMALQIPREALPYDNVDYKGCKSYTMNFERGSVSQLKKVAPLSP